MISRGRLIYVELKTGYNDTGPAWICEANTSKTGSTIYTNGLALGRSQGMSGNYFDGETGDEYWVSGIKKNLSDRHWAGSGSVLIDKNIVDRYLKEVGLRELPKHLVAAELKPHRQTDIQKAKEHLKISG
ncbi:MAG: hypothetical protein QNJ29_04515 [Rhizobiaceae bacterium]|nr:hypothetical protein [Rhizobiaceae bacterium]